MRSIPSSRGRKPSSRADGRKRERGIDQSGGALEVIVAVDVLLHHERGTAIELLVLLVAAAELGPEKIPEQPHERGSGPRVHRAGTHIAFNERRNFWVVEIGDR